MTEVVHHHTFDIYRWIRHGGYPALFGVLLLCGVGLPVPEDIPLIAAGILVEKGQFNLAIASLCAWCGIIGGDLILYTLGRKFGADIVNIPIIGSHINARRMERMDHWFNRYGVWVVAFGRLIAGIRGAMCVVAGTTHFKLWKFVLVDGLAALVSGGIFVFIGYKFGKNSERLHSLLHQIKGGMLLAVGLALVAAGIYYLLRNRMRRKPPRDLSSAGPIISPPADSAL